ncbi:MAG: regulatory protein RecX [Candidatus Omnitrophica bacterium]|nr:regulatory protein RecX [Candidatus Omnitrophota bacterium]MDD5512573.1 regulatory protein RecX [Candidatus Omnitrophota bacterium]
MRRDFATPREKARSYAFLLLKFRLRSEKEMRDYLAKKKLAVDVIDETVAFLKAKGFINDEFFARAWIGSRLKKPLGLRKLRQELAAKGIDRQLIQGCLGEITKNYCESDIVRKIAAEKFAKLKGVDPLKARQRIYRYLVYRGFSPQVVAEALNDV